MRHSHAALGFTTKYTMLKYIQNKFLMIWTSITSSVFNELFQSQKRPRRGIYIIKDREYGQKTKNAQDHQLQDENVETNLTPATHRNQKYVYCKIWNM